MPTGFSDLERSLGIATALGDAAKHFRDGGFSDLERSLGIATLGLPKEALGAHEFQ